MHQASHPRDPCTPARSSVGMQRGDGQGRPRRPRASPRPDLLPQTSPEAVGRARPLRWDRDLALGAEWPP